MTGFAFFLQLEREKFCLALFLEVETVGFLGVAVLAVKININSHIIVNNVNKLI